MTRHRNRYRVAALLVTAAAIFLTVLIAAPRDAHSSTNHHSTIERNAR